MRAFFEKNEGYFGVAAVITFLTITVIGMALSAAGRL